MGTDIWGTAQISGSRTFICLPRVAIQALERDQKHNINQNISITLAKSQLKEFRGEADVCCVGLCRDWAASWWKPGAPVMERLPGSPTRSLRGAGEDAGPRCHCVRTMIVMLTPLLPFLSCSFCLTRLQSPSGVQGQHVCPPCYQPCLSCKDWAHHVQSQLSNGFFAAQPPGSVLPAEGDMRDGRCVEKNMQSRRKHKGF